MDSPKPPRTNFDWTVYDSKKNSAVGHVECVFDARTGTWSEPKFVENQFITIHGLASGLHYGQQVYEGIMACRDPEGEIFIFRPQANAKRLNHSAAAVAIPPVPESLFMHCVHMAVHLNAEYCPPHSVSGSLYIRPVLFGSSCQIGLEPPDEFTFMVYCQAHIAFHGRGAIRAMIAEDFDRAATRGTGSAKVGGNYAPVIRWSQLAKKEGFNVLLHVDSRTQTEIEEFSTSGFIGVKNQNGEVTVVVSDSNAVIDSITVECVLELSRRFGWKTEKRPMKIEELATFQEVIAAGTAAGLVSIESIYKKSTSQTFTFEVEGAVFRRLWQCLKGIQKGTEEDAFGWRVKCLWNSEPLQNGH